MGLVEVWGDFGAVRMRTPRGFHVDHPIGCMGFAKQADGLVGRVEGWTEFDAVWVRTALVYHVDHPIGHVGSAEPPDGREIPRPDFVSRFTNLTYSLV